MSLHTGLCHTSGHREYTGGGTDGIVRPKGEDMKYVPLCERRRLRIIPVPLWEGWWDAADLPAHDHSNCYRRGLRNRVLWRVGWALGIAVGRGRRREPPTEQEEK